MEVPWQNLFSDMGMEDCGDMLKDGGQSGKSLMEEEDIGEMVEMQMQMQMQYSGSESSESQWCEKNKSGEGGSRKRCRVLSKSSSSNSSHLQLLHINDCDVAAAAAGGGGNSKGRMMRRKGRSSSESLDHIMAERKRRQELTQRFIALSATIPGLKKIDKASILSEAITYIKQLREQVNRLEEQSNKKIKVESVSFINKPNEGTASCKTSSDHDDNCHSSHRLNNFVALPEIEARALENEVLVRIHCKKQSGVMLKILTHLKGLDLSIVSNSVLPFGNSALDITIVAQMGEKYNVTVKDLVKSLRLAILESPEIQHC